jgi:hypothetical protein
VISNVCDGSLFRNGTFSVGNTAGALGSGGQLSFWGNGYGTPLVSSGQGYDDLGMVRLRGNKLQGDAVSQTLDPNRKIIQGKTYTFSGSARLEQGALLANHVKLGVIAYNGSLPSGPGHPIPSSSIALIGYLGKLNSLQWTTSELAPWKANKNFDKVAIYAINNYDNTLSSVWIDDLCMVEVPDTCDCWGIALDSIGNPIIPAPYDQYVDPNTSSVYDTLDYFKGYTTDLYGTGAAIDTISFDTCCVSIGGTVPEAALEMDFDDSLTAMGIFISADSMDKILKFVGDSTLNAKLGLLNPWSGLPRLDTFCCPPPFAALDSMSPFQGKDIVFVHGLEQGAIWEKITNNTGHEQTTWPADAKEFYNNYNGNGYYGRWKEDADEYWQAHIAHFLRGKGYKNRYLTIAWPSTQGLHVASHSMLAQISEAMINGQGVELLDPNDPRGTVGFGGQGYVIISHSTGGLVSDVAMSVANMTKTDLPLRQTLGPVGYISDAANVHVGVQAAFSGSNFATLAVAVFTRFPLLAPLLNIVANIDALSIQNIIGSFTAVQTSVLVDLIPQVTQLYWMNRYGRHTPVPVLTVAGGHPDRNFTLAVKGLLHKGFDDGVLSMDCQCGNNNFNPISTPSAYAPKPWPFHANVFDMGIGVESAIDYYVAQILESGSSFASAGCIAKLSPTGMVQPILWVPGWRNPHHRYTNHYSFIQSSSDNNSGPKGTTTNWPYFNDPYVFPYNYDPTIVLGETRNEEVRVITDNSVYSQNLVSDGIKSQVQEQIKGLKWTITFKFFGKKFSKSFWIWKRVYNRLEDFEVMTVMDYVYKYVCRP